jgi:ATP-dependent helicase Lhr and Lhr-like helicase
MGSAEEAARLSLMNAGTIPEWFDYEVLDLSTRQVIGRLDEEFAFESTPGQVIQLGGSTWKILAIAPGRVEVEPIDNEAPNLPFWFGDGAGRSRDLSRQVMQLCRRIERGQASDCVQLQAYLSDSRAILGRLPGPDCIVLERFFDPGGDQHLVMHSLAGARTNRAWGLALRKRFCRQFNFELQAAATDDGLLISLGAVHSFDLPEVAGYLRSSNVRDVLIQALLDTPVFQTRFRWCANTALAIKRRELRGPVPAQIQRNQTENLIARVFPDQLACLENLSGAREIPDHPLVAQALADCLNDYMDIDHLERMLAGIESGRIRIHAVDTDSPSPLARALIHAPRHSFLDPAAAEERRTRTFEQSARSASVTSPYRPLRRNEFEQLLLAAGYLTAAEGEGSGNVSRLMTLVHDQSAVSLVGAAPGLLWVHIERLAEALALWPKAGVRPFLPAGLRPDPIDDADEALRRLILGRIRHCRVLTVGQLSAETGLPSSRIEQALAHLKAEGVITSGASKNEVTWTERRPIESQQTAWSHPEASERFGVT